MNEQINIYLKNTYETTIKNITNRYKELENKKDINKKIETKKIIDANRIMWWYNF